MRWQVRSWWVMVKSLNSIHSTNKFLFLEMILPLSSSLSFSFLSFPRFAKNSTINFQRKETLARFAIDRDARPRLSHRSLHWWSRDRNHHPLYVYIYNIYIIYITYIYVCVCTIRRDERINVNLHED